MTDPTKSAGGMGPYGCSEREIEIARSICDSYPVINAFTAPEWAKLDDGGKAWIATIVRQAIALGATLDTTPPSEPNPEAPTLAGPLNAVLQARADDPDRPFLSEGGGGALSPLKGEPEGLREALEALDQILGLEKCWKDTEAGVRMPYELREALKEARRAKAALLSRADTPAGAGGDVEPKAVVCVDPAGEPYWPSAKPTEAESRRVCFGVCDARRREEIVREGWRCVPVYLDRAEARDA